MTSHDRTAEPDYLRDNRANWDDRAILHAESPDYRVAEFLADPTVLSDAVRFDLPRLGDVGGLRAVHLQCHIGTDTVSLARLGARPTGLDLSPGSIRQAEQLAERTGAEVAWVVSDVYDAVAALGPTLGTGDARGAYDLVYVSLGSLGWLPSVDRWAAVVADLLRPGGRLFLRELHPAATAVVATDDGRLAVEQPWFEQPEAQIDDVAVSYVATSRALTATRSHWFSHGLGELITAVLGHDLRLTAFEEHDTAPFRAFGDQMEPVGVGEYRLVDRPERLPLSYTLQAVRSS